MVTTIFFRGRLMSVPGAYSDVDASGLEAAGLTSAGVVCLVGLARGGKPYTAIDLTKTIKPQLESARSQSVASRFYRGGDLREAVDIVFAPSLDPAAEGGADEAIFVKVNPSIQSQVYMVNGGGNCALIKSVDYGYHTRQVYFTVATGTTKGKLVTVGFESTTEPLDNVGGDTLASLIFLAATPAGGYSTLTATNTASAWYTSFTLARAGLDGDITNPAVAGQVVEIVSTGAGDTTQIVTLYGLDAAGAAQTETITCNGVTPVAGAKTWQANGVLAGIISPAPAGNVTVRRVGAGLTLFTLVPATLFRGLAVLSNATVANEVLSLVRSAPGVENVLVVGTSDAGAAAVEKVTLAGAVPVSSTGKWSALTYLVLGELAAAGTVTVSAKSVNITTANSATLQALADRFNATPGYTCTLGTGATATLLTDLDYLTAANCKSPTSASLTADLMAVVNKLNSSSQLVSATRVTGATGAPSNTAAKTFLAGGHEGSATPGQEATPTAQSSDWTAAWRLLYKFRFNTVVPVTGDAAQHAAALTTARYKCGVIGRSECDAKVGFMNAALTGPPTKAEILTKVVALNSRHVQTWAQRIKRYASDGTLTTFEPPFGAVMMAGLQAALPLGWPQTRKYLNTLDLLQDSSWNPVDDAEELLQAGLCFGEAVDGVGFRVVRGITSYLISSNLAYTEASANRAVDYCVYSYRTEMEIAIGQPGFGSRVAGIKALSKAALERQVNVTITTFQKHQLELVSDIIEAGAEISPVLPINFVKAVLHLALPVSAAAA